jgi:hypothetical protein
LNETGSWRARASRTILFTGGGHTELRLNLLFDVALAPASLNVQDARQMTGPSGSSWMRQFWKPN